MEEQRRQERNTLPYEKDTKLQESSINIPQFLSIALGGNPFLHSYIDDYYGKNEWAYYEAYQKSGLKGNPMFAMYTTRSEEKIRQVAGIVEWCYQNQQLTLLDQLIKKGYKFVYQYVQRHTLIDFEHFIRSYAKKQKGKKVTEIELFYQNIVLWYLCVRDNKPFDTNNITWKSFQVVLQSAMTESKLEELNFSTQVLEQHQAEIAGLYEEYQIPKNLPFESLGVLLEYIIGHSLRKIYHENPHLDIEKAQQKIFQESPTKHIGALGGWLKILKIHELDATEQMPFTKRDLDMVFMEYLHAKEHNQITKEEQDLFIIACLYIECLSFHYQDSKQLYLDQSKLDYYLDMRAKESRIIQQEKDQFKKQREWKQSYQNQEKEIEGFIKELREAQLKIRQLEQKIDNMEDNTKEVHALRSYVYNMEQDIDYLKQVPPLSSMTTYIQTKRVVIFGGHPNWQQKLKEVIPAVEFVDVEEKNRNISKVQKSDAIFINTSVFTHAFYKKIMKELSKGETPLFYLSGQSNIEKTLVEIYHWLS